MAEALDHLHLKGRIHADLKPLNVVRVGATWQLVDLDVSCAIGDPFGTKKPSLGYCPPEMAQTCVEINQCDGCTRQFFAKSFLGDDAAVLAPSSDEEPASPRYRAGGASMAWRTTRRFSTNAP